MSQHDAQMLAIAGTCLVVVIVAMYLMRFIRIDGAFGRSAYRVVFSLLAGLLAPTLVVGGHGALPAPFIACLPLLAHNTTSIAALELGGYGLLAIGTDIGGGVALVARETSPQPREGITRVTRPAARTARSPTLRHPRRCSPSRSAPSA